MMTPYVLAEMELTYRNHELDRKAERARLITDAALGRGAGTTGIARLDIAPRTLSRLAAALVRFVTGAVPSNAGQSAG